MSLSKKLTSITTLSKVLALVLYFFVMILGFYLGVQYQKGRTAPNSINSYDECVAAGGRIAESYPSVCFSQDGKSSFTNPYQKLPQE